MASVIDIEGIDEGGARRLREAGVSTVEQLLTEGATKQGRKSLARRTGIEKAQLKRWVAQADLFRIQGVAGRYASLLEAGGAATVSEVAERKPGKLRRQLAKVNEQRALVQRVPPKAVLAGWIESARCLPRGVDL
jgi:hypothetical protein